MYTQDMTPSWYPETMVPNHKKIAKYVEVGREDKEYAFERLVNVKQRKPNYFAETEPGFPLALPRMSYGLKLDSSQEKLDVSMSTLSSECISANSAKLWKYLDCDRTDLFDESNWDFCNLSDSTFHCHSNAFEEQRYHIDPRFEQIKANCLCDPRLMEKVMVWSRRHCNSSRIRTEDMRNLWQGRIWITLRSVNSNKEMEQDRFEQEALDNLKGAYQETELGVYKQPKVQGSDAGMQHRLLKNSDGLWAIDRYDPTLGLWSPAAREQPDGLWVDCGYNKIIDLVVLPMRSILGRLRVDAPHFENVMECMEFLYTSCDQSKLNRKLKPRTLKHQINNTIVKLKKLNALNFAVTVAKTAQALCDHSQLSHAG